MMEGWNDHGRRVPSPPDNFLNPTRRVVNGVADAANRERDRPDEAGGAADRFAKSRR